MTWNLIWLEYLDYSRSIKPPQKNDAVFWVTNVRARSGKLGYQFYFQQFKFPTHPELNVNEMFSKSNLWCELLHASPKSIILYFRRGSIFLFFCRFFSRNILKNIHASWVVFLFFCRFYARNILVNIHTSWVVFQ